jgi:hypothetical protein
MKKKTHFNSIANGGMSFYLTTANRNSVYKP